MTQSSGSIASKSIALKYGMASEPYRLHLIFKTGHDRFAIQLRFTFLKHYRIESKMFLRLTKIFIDYNKIFGRYAKIWIFLKIIFCRITFQSQCMII
jgi:hypothetical protein